MMRTQKKGRKEEIIKELAAAFLNQEGNTSSLLTVTRVELSPDSKNALIYFTVFPQHFEKSALEFANRKIPDFKEYIKSKSSLPRLPFFRFVIDSGEKNRQKIDSLLG